MADLADTQKKLADQKKAERFVKPSFIVATLLFVAMLVAIAVPGKVVPKTPVPFYVAVVIMELLFLWRYIVGGKKVLVK